MLTAVEIIGMTLTTDVWTSYDDPLSKLTFNAHNSILSVCIPILVPSNNIIVQALLTLPELQ